MNRSTFLTSLLALPATVKALAESFDGDDIIVQDTDPSNIYGAELYADDEHIATLSGFSIEDDFIESADGNWRVYKNGKSHFNNTTDNPLASDKITYGTFEDLL